MSPSEDQLRAALRAGEGSAPSADDIIGRAVAWKTDRRRQRVRALGMVAAVAVVAGLGAALAAAGHGSRHGTASSASSRAAVAAGPAVPGGNNLDQGSSEPYDSAQQQSVGAGGLAGAGGAGGNGAGGATVDCPSQPVQYALPGGGGTNQFGASGSLFGTAVQSIVVCRYSTQQGSLASDAVLTSTAARDLAARLDASTLTSDAEQCAHVGSVELLPTGTDGKALTPITISGGCTVGQATNGTAVRHVLWSEVDATPPPGVSPPVTGVMSGSPPH